MAGFKRLQRQVRWFDSFKDELPSQEGKVIVITGTTSGTGMIAARALAEKGATLVLLNRPSKRADEALATLREAVPDATFVAVECDLQNFDSVRAAAATVAEKYDAIDALANNAGVMALADESTKDGYDVQMQTNVISSFLLTALLMPLLERGAELRGEARVVAHTSVARFGKKLQAKYFKKGMGGKLGGNGASMLLNGARWERYHQTKLADCAFIAALGDRLAASGSKVKATLAHPGVASTNLQVTTNQDGGMGTWFSNLFMRFSQSQEDGAMGLIKCIAAKGVKNRDFYGPGQGRAAFSGPVKKLSMESFYDNKATKDLFWESCEAAVGPFKIGEGA